MIYYYSAKLCHKVLNMSWLLLITSHNASDWIPVKTNHKWLWLAVINKQRRIYCNSQLNQDSIPFKYWGIPIKSSRLNKNVCQLLLHMICANIIGWALKRLTYAGKVELINSVLMSMHTYWGQMFIIPQYITNKVNETCQNFLWRDIRVP